MVCGHPEIVHGIISRAASLARYIGAFGDHSVSQFADSKSTFESLDAFGTELNELDTDAAHEYFLQNTNAPAAGIRNRERQIGDRMQILHSELLEALESVITE